jgi:hypothetical protein
VSDSGDAPVWAVDSKPGIPFGATLPPLTTLSLAVLWGGVAEAEAAVGAFAADTIGDVAPATSVSVAKGIINAVRKFFLNIALAFLKSEIFFKLPILLNIR